MRTDVTVNFSRNLFEFLDEIQREDTYFTEDEYKYLMYCKRSIDGMRTMKITWYNMIKKGHIKIDNTYDNDCW